MNDEAKTLLHALITAIWYQTDDEELLDVIQEVIDRINQDFDLVHSNIEWSDLGNIIYGMLVCTYGDFGTSPRSGWFINESAKQDSLVILEEEKSELERMINEHKESEEQNE